MSEVADGDLLTKRKREEEVKPKFSFSFAKNAPPKKAVSLSAPQIKILTEDEILDETDEQPRKKKKQNTFLARIARGELESQKTIQIEITEEEKIELKRIEEEKKKLPLLMRNKIPGLDDIKDEEERFKADIASRPDECSLEDYNTVTIEDFGKGLLMSMGWKGGKIGLNGRGLDKPIEYISRPDRLGLGAIPKPETDEKKKYIKPGESRESKKHHAPIVDKDTGKKRHYKKIDEKLPSRSSSSSNNKNNNSRRY